MAQFWAVCGSKLNCVTFDSKWWEVYSIELGHRVQFSFLSSVQSLFILLRQFTLLFELNFFLIQVLFSLLFCKYFFFFFALNFCFQIINLMIDYLVHSWGKFLTYKFRQNFIFILNLFSLLFYCDLNRQWMFDCLNTIFLFHENEKRFWPMITGSSTLSFPFHE